MLRIVNELARQSSEGEGEAVSGWIELNVPVAQTDEPSQDLDQPQLLQSEPKWRRMSLRFPIDASTDEELSLENDANETDATEPKSLALLDGSL